MMLRRRTTSQVDAPGQDSFLDVVCNLVGILIVLVMLIAAQAKRGMIDAATAGKTDAAAVSEDEIKAAAATADAVELSVQELQAKIDRQNLEAAARQVERDQYQVLVKVAEQRLAEHRDRLSARDRERYDLEQVLARSRSELSRLEAMQVSLTRAKPHVLEHLPTPMARTVFGTEVHFRLQGHRLAYVPWDEVLERMKADAPRHVNKLKDVPRMEFSLPVIAGYGSRYVLRRTDVEVETRVGTAHHTGVELEQVYMVDVEPNLGQPIAEALAPNSELFSRLAGLKPQNTTVTIWVYPDSFDDFRPLKSELFQRGFLTAARPMPTGEPIAGSPAGSRSAAE